MAVQHLASLGKTNIAFLGWPEGSLTGDERFSGWQEALAEAGLNIESNAVKRAEDSYDIGIATAEELVKEGFDAVVCVSDTFALGIMAGLSRLGLVPGRDLAVVGFDNIAAAQLVEPGLSSLHQPMAEVGETMVNQLARVLAGQPVEQSQILIPPRLVERGSTASQQLPG